MPLRDHLVEARKRFVWAIVGVAAGAVGGWFLFDPVFELLQRPVAEAAERDEAIISINFTGVATALDMRLKVAVFLGVILSSPWWLYQLWAFVAPGLKKVERRYTLFFLAAAIPLFAAGVGLGVWILPRAVAILSDFVPQGSANLIDANIYLTFSMRLLLAFGVAFVFPVVMVGLTWMGAVTPRRWLRGWRWAVMIIFLFAAIATPTADAVTMLALAFPMCGLYFLAIGIGALRRRTRREAGA